MGRIFLLGREKAENSEKNRKEPGASPSLGNPQSWGHLLAEVEFGVPDVVLNQKGEVFRSI